MCWDRVIESEQEPTLKALSLPAPRSAQHAGEPASKRNASIPEAVLESLLEAPAVAEVSS